jgi:hypothetical protein
VAWRDVGDSPRAIHSRRSRIPTREPSTAVAELFSGADRDPDVETSDIGSLEDEAFRTVDGAQSDEPEDPAFQAVIEAGGGVSEGFEQAEAQLVDNATDDDLASLKRVLGDAGQPEEDEDQGVYGEADEERSSESAD